MRPRRPVQGTDRFRPAPSRDRPVAPRATTARPRALARPSRGGRDGTSDLRAVVRPGTDAAPGVLRLLLHGPAFQALHDCELQQHAAPLVLPRRPAGAHASLEPRPAPGGPPGVVPARPGAVAVRMVDRRGRRLLLAAGVQDRRLRAAGARTVVHAGRAVPRRKRSQGRGANAAHDPGDGPAQSRARVCGGGEIAELQPRSGEGPRRAARARRSRRLRRRDVLRPVLRREPREPRDHPQRLERSDGAGARRLAEGVAGRGALRSGGGATDALDAGSRRGAAVREGAGLVRRQDGREAVGPGASRSRARLRGRHGRAAAGRRADVSLSRGVYAPLVGAWYVYILRCRDRTLYTGITNDLERRLTAHRSGAGAKYTRSRRPVTLAYEERQPDRGSALKREAALRRLGRAGKLALVSRSKGASMGILLLLALSVASGATAPETPSVTTLALPGAPADGVALDYLAVDREGSRVWVPAGGTGSTVVMDNRTQELRRIEGFHTAVGEGGGRERIVGPEYA